MHRETTRFHQLSDCPFVWPWSRPWLWNVRNAHEGHLQSVYGERISTSNACELVRRRRMFELLRLLTKAKTPPSTNQPVELVFSAEWYPRAIIRIRVKIAFMLNVWAPMYFIQPWVFSFSLPLLLSCPWFSLFPNLGYHSALSFSFLSSLGYHSAFSPWFFLVFSYDLLIGPD